MVAPFLKQIGLARAGWSAIAQDSCRHPSDGPAQPRQFDAPNARPVQPKYLPPLARPALLENTTYSFLQALP